MSLLQDYVAEQRLHFFGPVLGLQKDHLVPHRSEPVDLDLHRCTHLASYDILIRQQQLDRFGAQEVPKSLLPRSGEYQRAGSRIDQHPALDELVVVEPVGNGGLGDDAPHGLLSVAQSASAFVVAIILRRSRW